MYSHHHSVVEGPAEKQPGGGQKKTLHPCPASLSLSLSRGDRPKEVLVTESPV